MPAAPRSTPSATRAGATTALADARVGALVDDASTWGLHHVLDGFAYRRFAGAAPTEAAPRLAWLAGQIATHLGEDFRPDPWRRLIRVLRRTGHGRSARDVAIGRERHLRRAGLIGRGAPPALRGIAGVLHDGFGLVAGYGYRPMRLLASAAVVWALFGVLYGAAAERGALAPNAALVTAEPRLAPCRPDCTQLPVTMPAFAPLIYSLDVLLPVVDLQQTRHWKPVRNALAPEVERWSGTPLLQMLMWIEAACGWLIGLTLLASLTGLTNRDRRL